MTILMLLFLFLFLLLLLVVVVVIGCSGRVLLLMVFHKNLQLIENDYVEKQLCVHVSVSVYVRRIGYVWMKVPILSLSLLFLVKRWRHCFISVDFQRMKNNKREMSFMCSFFLFFFFSNCCNCFYRYYSSWYYYFYSCCCCCCCNCN